MRIAVVQNFELTPLGALDKCIAQRADYVKVFHFFSGEQLPSDSTQFDGLVILGGPMYAEDDENHPQLRDIVNFIHHFHLEKKPILGICLGAQLIARSFGGRVYKSSKFELGFTPVFVVETLAIEDPLLDKCPPRLHVMQWHFDTFDLPTKATLLMYGKQCRNQAYRIGHNIYGFQFHLEVNRSILEAWIETRDDFIRSNYPKFSQMLTEQIDRYLKQSEEFCYKVGNSWLDLVEARMATNTSLN